MHLPTVAKEAIPEYRGARQRKDIGKPCNHLFGEQICAADGVYKGTGCWETPRNEEEESNRNRCLRATQLQPGRCTRMRNALRRARLGDLYVVPREVGTG
jgi:hypothetical protein